MSAGPVRPAGAKGALLSVLGVRHASVEPSAVLQGPGDCPQPSSLPWCGDVTPPGAGKCRARCTDGRSRAPRGAEVHDRLPPRAPSILQRMRMPRADHDNQATAQLKYAILLTM